MTAIAGFVHSEGVTLMADSGASNEHCLLFEDTQPKIIKLGDALVGVSGSIRLRQLLEVYGTPPAPVFENPVPSLVRWATEIQELAKAHGQIRTTKEGLVEIDNRLLVAIGGRLFEMDSALQVLEPATPYWSIGCGQAETRAAMHALAASLGGRPDHETAETILTRAMRATAAFNVHVCDPFITKTIYTR